MFGFDCKVSAGWPAKHKKKFQHCFVVTDTSDEEYSIYNTEVLVLYKDYF